MQKQMLFKYLYLNAKINNIHCLDKTYLKFFSWGFFNYKLILKSKGENIHKKKS